VPGKLLAFGNYRARADNAAAADPRPIHDNRAHPDQRAVLDRATVQDDVVTNRAVLPDRQRKTPIGVAGRIVLHVGVLTDLDPLVVAAEHRAEPYARLAVQAHLADDGGRLGNEIMAVSGELGPLPVKPVDRHKVSVSVAKETLT
jgi:hypothetical protein